jgi:branched-chain amino acid transport system permease protein
VEEFLQHVLLGVAVGSIYSLVGIGLVVIFRASGVLNFAQGNLLAIGALVIWSFAVQLGLPLWTSIVLGLGCATLLGLLVEKLTIHPLMGQPALSSIAMTLAVGLGLEAAGSFIWGTWGKGYPTTYLPRGVPADKPIALAK